MGDRVKVFLAIVFFVSALILPLVGLAIGWSKWDFETGLMMMGVIFLGLFVLGGVVLFRVENLNWLTVSLPYLFGVGYTLSPDLIPLGGDDAVMTATGSLMAYLLALRKDPRTPKWIIVPLLLAAAYTLFGGTVPGGLDEIMINLFAIGLAGYGVRRATNEDQLEHGREEIHAKDEILEGEFKLDN